MQALTREHTHTYNTQIYTHIRIHTQHTRTTHTHIHNTHIYTHIRIHIQHTHTTHTTHAHHTYTHTDTHTQTHTHTPVAGSRLRSFRCTLQAYADIGPPCAKVRSRSWLSISCVISAHMYDCRLRCGVLYIWAN